MAGDFNKPVVTDAYASVLQSIKDLMADLAKGLDGTGTTNVPVNTIRWSSDNNRFEKYDGSTWAALASTFAMNVASVAGKIPGLAANNLLYLDGNAKVPLANMYTGSGSGLNADQLDGVDISNIFRNQGVVTAANDTTATGFGVYNRTQTGFSDTILSFNVGGSTGPVQLSFHHGGEVNYRNQTDSTNWQAWRRFLTSANAPGAFNAQAAGTYGGMNITGASGGWAGFQFNSTSRYFMSSSGQTGEYDTSAGAWQWRWDDGTLVAGTVPWARLSGVPSLSFYPVGGGNLSGYVAVANEGASPEPYGAISVTKPNVTETPSYFSMTRAGQFTASIGINPSNQMVFGNGTSGASGRITSSWMTLNGSGQVWTSSYGWLHDYFVTSGATYWELKYSWSVSQATAGPSINCHANYGAGVYLAVVNGNPKPFITNGYGAIATCDVLVGTSSYTTVTGSGDVAPTPPFSKSLYIYKLRKV